MPRLELSRDEIVRVLTGQEIVRVAFHDGRSSYLIPLGYAYVGTALYGVTEPGRKTGIGAAHPTVAFQVDTSLETGVFEWESVTGEGRFEIVSDQAERQKAMRALQPVIAKAPDWWIQEQGPKIAAGLHVVWRLTPTQMSGCRYRRRGDAPNDPS